MRKNANFIKLVVLVVFFYIYFASLAFDIKKRHNIPVRVLELQSTSRRPNVNSTHKHNGEDLIAFASAGNVPQIRSTYPKACNDTALFYSINSKSWGIHSKQWPAPSVKSALQSNNVVWLTANWISLPKGKSQCASIMDALMEMTTTEPRAANKTLKLLITDASDIGSGFAFPGRPMHKCLQSASARLRPEHTYLASRRLEVGRNLGCFKPNGRNGQQCTPRTLIGEVNGTVVDYRNKTVASYLHNGIVAKWDFAVRSDYLPVFEQEVRRELGLPENVTVGEDDFDRLPRRLDIAHLWNSKTKDGMSAFRNKVTDTVQGALQMYNLTGTAGLVSARGRTGRRSVQEPYASALLGHKIIIVAQRDGWEDHLRLFESLSGGAMVLSDPITHPPVGLVDGKNIVYYQSLMDLLNKIRHWTKEENDEERARIGRNGRRLVLDHQRANHRFERLMLGENWPKNWEDPVAPLLDCG